MGMGTEIGFEWLVTDGHSIRDSFSRQPKKNHKNLKSQNALLLLLSIFSLPFSFFQSRCCDSASAPSPLSFQCHKPNSCTGLLSFVLPSSSFFLDAKIK